MGDERASAASQPGEEELELAREEIDMLTRFNNSMTHQYVDAMRRLSPEQRRAVRQSDIDSDED